MDLSALKQNILADLRENEDEIIAFRRNLHRHPELSGLEFETSKKIFDILTSNGIAAEYIDVSIGVTALIEGGRPGKTIAYRADIDALQMPETAELDYASCQDNIMHACGHDLHTAILLGASLALNKFKDQLEGNIRIIFQSGEENCTGAKTAISYGVMDNPKVDQIIALHTWPDLEAGSIGLRKGPMMASSSRFEARVDGVGGHGAHPHKSVDPVVILAQIITAYQSIISRNINPLDTCVITVAQVRAGTANNIIPEFATASGTIRTFDSHVLASIKARMTTITEEIAKAFGGKGAIEFVDASFPVINDDQVIEVFEQVAGKLIGGENVHWLDGPSMGSEDFAYYLQKAPGAIIRLGTANPSDPRTQKPLHNSDIVFDERAILLGMEVMTATVLELLMGE